MRAARFALFIALTAGTLVAGCGHRRHHTASACPEGTAWDGASCAPFASQAQVVIPADPAPIAEEPPQQQAQAAPEPAWTCPGSSVAQGDGCVCPEGTAWIAEQCQVAQAQLPAPSSAPQRRRSAWIPAPPAAPPPPNVNIHVHVDQVARGLAPREQPSPPPQQQPAQQAPRSQPASSPPPNVSYAACTNGMIRNGNACQCPQGSAWENGGCLVPCHPTQRRDGKQCVCPRDTRWNGASCELWQECRGGQVHMGVSCICPSQTLWDGQRCAPNAPSGAPRRR